MMQLRRLQPQDAPLMLEWMHDADAVQHMRANFAAMTLADCERFIAAAQKDTPALHRAIADENGTYQGTVSLKNIDPAKGEAEFAIAVRRCAMGRGVDAQTHFFVTGAVVGCTAVRADHDVVLKGQRLAAALTGTAIIFRHDLLL